MCAYLNCHYTLFVVAYPAIDVQKIIWGWLVITAFAARSLELLLYVGILTRDEIPLYQY